MRKSDYAIWRVAVFHKLLEVLPSKAGWELIRLANIDVPGIVTDYAKKTVCRCYSGDWEYWTDRCEVLLHRINHVRNKGDYHVPKGFELEDLFESEIVRLFNFLEPMEPPFKDIDDMKSRTEHEIHLRHLINFFKTQE